MTPPSKRKAVVALALAALVATAGCTSFLGGDDGSGGDAKLDSVPADAQMVGYVDVDGAVGDDSLRSLTNTLLETQAENAEYDPGPASVPELLDEFENESGLDPAGVHDVTYFASTDTDAPMAGESAGMILTSEYSEDELVSAMREDGSELSETTYGETTLYTYGYEGSSALAVLGDGTFALGDRSSVESVVDVRAGDTDALNGELRTTYENTRDGYARFAMDVPQEDVPADQIGAGSPVDTSAFNTVQFVSGSFYTSGDEVGLEVDLTSEDESSASRTYDVVDGAIGMYSGMVEDELRATLEKLTVSQDGDTVTVSYTNTVSDLEEQIESYNATLAGSDSASGSESASESTDDRVSVASLTT